MKQAAPYLFLPILGIAFFLMAEAAEPTKPTPLEHKIAEFKMNDATFVEAVSELSREPIDGMHLGLEEVLRERVSDQPLPNPRFSLALHQTTVKELLDALCAHDVRYTWSQDGRTINVYPKSTIGDDTYLLNRSLERISVTAISDPGDGLTFLDRQLPPPREQLAYGGFGGSSSYDMPWTQTFTQVSVRQFINRLSEHMGAHTCWLFYGSKQERLFTFLKGGFH
jgi:hypothetical protein